MKRKKEKLTERIEIRVSPYEKNFIQGLADLYATGNLSLFLVNAAFNSDRKFLKENDLRESRRRTKKKCQTESLAPYNNIKLEKLL